MTRAQRSGLDRTDRQQLNFGYMKTRLSMMVWGIIGMLATSSMGQVPVITSLGMNGQLSWTNAVNTNALYRVEWAAQAGGPWYRTFANIGTLDGHGATGFTVPVPMFYRVAMVTNEPPQGMVWIEGGEVELGDSQGVGGRDERPVHTNFVSGFWMDEMEVTGAQWAEVYHWALTNEYTFLPFADAGETNQQPAQLMNWLDCVLWCNARSQMEGLTPCYYTSDALSTVHTNNMLFPNFSNSWVNWTASGYRLPTVAEWEKAARGGRQRRLFPWGGDTIQHARANYVATNSFSYDTSPTPGYHPLYNDGEYPVMSPAGSFPANGYGLHDMAGNVWEWCWDRYGAYLADYQADPHGPESETYDRVLRGGSCFRDAYSARCAVRKKDSLGVAYHDYGFRCVRKQ
jgi:formylglycine-generating enzyme required for sulfatase activity